MPSGIELDLTREQFQTLETISEPDAVPRPEDTTNGRLAAQYARLAAAVRDKLDRH